MPYIKQYNREELDDCIEDLVEILQHLSHKGGADGNLNYTVTKIIHRLYGNKESTRYTKINEAIGVLECIKQEYYRKVAAPYEDVKEIEYGEII